MSEPSTWTPERRNRLSSLLIVGLSYAQAARNLGVSRGSVCWATARYGIGRKAANLSRATGRQRGGWEERLTESWADRASQRRAATAREAARPPAPVPGTQS